MLCLRKDVSRREVDLVPFVVREPDLRGPDAVREALDIHGAGHGLHPGRMAQEPRHRDGGAAHAVPSGDFADFGVERRKFLAAQEHALEEAVLEGRPRLNGDAAQAAEVQHAPVAADRPVVQHVDVQPPARSSWRWPRSVAAGWPRGAAGRRFSVAESAWGSGWRRRNGAPCRFCSSWSKASATSSGSTSASGRCKQQYVQIIGLQPLENAVHRLQNVFLGEIKRDALPDAALGLQNDRLAHSRAHVDGFRENLLAGAVAIDIRMIEEVGAQLQRRMHKTLRLRLIQAVDAHAADRHDRDPAGPICRVEMVRMKTALLTRQLVDLQHILPVQLLQAADGLLFVERRAGRLLRHQLQLALVDAELPERPRQTHLAEELAQARDALLDDRFRVPIAARNAHDVDRKLHEHVDVVPIDVLHPRGRQDREARAVRHVVDRAELVLHAVAGPVLRAAHAYQPVVRDRAAEAHLAPGVVVRGVGKYERRVFHDGSEHRLAQAVRQVGVDRVGEVALKDVAHHVRHAIGDLVFRQGEEEFGVHDAQKRPQARAAVAVLELLGFVGDHGVAACFAAGRRDGQDGRHGQHLLDGLALLVDLPDVPVVKHAHRDGLGRIDGAPAAHGEDQVDVLLPAQRDALVHQREPGVGHHAAQLDVPPVDKLQK